MKRKRMHVPDGDPLAFLSDKSNRTKTNSVDKSKVSKEERQNLFLPDHNKYYYSKLTKGLCPGKDTQNDKFAETISVWT